MKTERNIFIRKDYKMEQTGNTLLGIVLVGTGTLIAMTGKKLLAQTVKVIL